MHYTHNFVDGPRVVVWNADPDPLEDKTMTCRSSATNCFLLLLGVARVAAAGELAEISNYREYSPTFSSSGQPTKKQLEMLRDSGFERIVYIAFTNSGKAFADEDQIVKKLGMDYVQIPVDWENPNHSDFRAFAGAMQSNPAKRTLLHCQVNYRASAFGFLYRVIYERVPVEDAKRDMNSVWEPDETWRRFIFEVLEENGISPKCDGCDWTD
ncbi:MAG: protein tyrosine phosphatase family protein [Woeseiaceae bacterium]|nr:protein tyrosine phosphatase family protein [Woeseiaceae bacterium]